MAENDFSQSLSDTLSRLMESPEVLGILSSLQNSTAANENENGNGNDNEKAVATREDGGINIPPDLMEKLPSVIAALSGMGIGGTGTGGNIPKTPVKQKSTGDGQRKALLSSLRPYLSPHRQSIIDNMLRIEGLAGLLSSALPSTANTDAERR